MRVRKVLLIVAIVLTFLVLVALSAVALLWISVGGTFFRGEAATIGTVFQIAVAVLACVGLAILIRWLVHATKRV